MRIVSWNLQWGRGADGRVDYARTVAALRLLAADGATAPEVMCLQEVARNFDGLAGGSGEDGVALLQAAFPGYEAVYGAALDVARAGGGRAQFGNLILSRVPVLQAFRHLLPFPADPSVPGMPRGCVEVVLDAPGGPLRVLTTHLEYYSALQRRAQVLALRSLQAEALGHARLAGRMPERESNPAFAPRPRPARALLCGDFNCEPGSVDHAAMVAREGFEGAGWNDAWRCAHGDRPHAPSVGLHGAEWPERAYCCDFFWVSDELTASVAAIEVDAATDASDHQPVVLDLTL